MTTMRWRTKREKKKTMKEPKPIRYFDTIGIWSFKANIFFSFHFDNFNSQFLPIAFSLSVYYSLENIFWNKTGYTQQHNRINISIIHLSCANIFLQCSVVYCCVDGHSFFLLFPYTFFRFSTMFFEYENIWIFYVHFGLEFENNSVNKAKQNSIMHRAIKLSDSIQCGFNNCNLFWCIHHQNWHQLVSCRYCRQHCFKILIYSIPRSPNSLRFNMQRMNAIDWIQMSLHWISNLQ